MELRWLVGVALVLAALPVASAAVEIAPWFPQGNSYVFVCLADDFAPTGYDWNFGDGQRLFDMERADVYHTFSENGTYEVSCTATDGDQSRVSLLRVKVGEEPQLVPPEANESWVELKIAPWYPQGPNGRDYVFMCEPHGFTPTTYDWYFTDGEKLLDVVNSDVFHRFDAAGVYDVDCTATDGNQSRVAQVQIIVGGIDEEPTELLDAHISIAEGFPYGRDYVFSCHTDAFEAATYSWFFGDGEKLVDLPLYNVYHGYAAAGDYTVTCDAKDASGLFLAKGTIEVSVE